MNAVGDVLDKDPDGWGMHVVGFEITAIEPVRHDGRNYASWGKL